jgi:ferredoxin-NADP reductase/Na+-translocating ferredoxin:NAD+ oxidoreductase RnfD subunit
MQPLRFIDRQLNTITMYRLLLYGLAVIAGASIALSLLGVSGLGSVSLLLSLGLLIVVCYGANQLLASLCRVIPNMESSLITALILFMLLPPVTDGGHALASGLAGLAAIASKYLLLGRDRHIFNPAAFGLAVATVSGLSSSMWWVGSAYMLPFTIILGLLVVRKIRRFQLLASFTTASLIVALLVGLMHSRNIGSIFSLAIVSGPLVFAGCIMLTEPATAPSRRQHILIYGALVGVIMNLHLSLGPLSSTPEIALLIGNIYALAVTPASSARLRLTAKRQLSERIYDFSFQTSRPLQFQPGQYVELTMAVPSADDRGNRRAFSIASAPGESELHIGVKFYQPSSRFKQVLRQLEAGAIVQAGHVGGSFTLPNEPTRKLVMIAGGIGITPFRSQLADLLQRQQKRDITLIYLVSKPEEISYRDDLERAKDELGLKLIPIVTTTAAGWSGLVGTLDNKLLQKVVPDCQERYFMVSGPNVMVDSISNMLHQAGVERHNIKTDHFSGY